MKFLVSGHQGFIGPRLIYLLNQAEIQWYGFDLVEGNDIRDKIKLDKLFETSNFDGVIHLAALAGVRRGEDYPEEYVSTNIIGTKNLIEMCQKYGVNRFLFFSSSSVLGGNYSDKGLTENDVCNPASFYGITKLAGELMVRNSGLESIIVRPFTVYGENGRPDMVIWKWIEQIKSGRSITFYGDGTTKRGYVYVGDLVEGTTELIKRYWINNTSIPVYNDSLKKTITVHLGGSEVITLDYLLEIFTEFCDKNNIRCRREQLPRSKSDVTNSYSDISLARNLIGFDPKPVFKEKVLKILSQSL